MKKYSYLSMSLAAGVFLLAGTLAAAQTASTTETVQSHDSVGSPNGTGQNPLYESKGKADLKPGAGASNVQPYKDPEDMTTRYRPGNNKTASSATTPSGTNSAQQQKTVENPVGEMKTADKSVNSAPAVEPAQKKHIAGVKYNDRAAAADSSKTPKVDSFPVKQ